MKPLILITPSKEFFQNKLTNIFFVREKYISRIVQAGGIPLISSYTHAEEYADLADGLLLTGGDDITPSIFGEEMLEGSHSVCQYDRDEFEIELLRQFEKRGKPILGICRGLQVINVAFGGTIWQDLALQTASYHDERFHLLKAEEGSVCEKLFGKVFNANSFHHQAVKKLGDGLIIDALAYTDNVIEAIRHKDKPIFAVQWHPELMDEMEPVFAYFMEMIKKENLHKQDKK